MDNLKTSFGKIKVDEKRKTSLVQDIFTEVSNNYDLMNDLMSFGAHRLWKKSLVDVMNIQSGDKIIDVGSGTGDIFKIILLHNKKINGYAVDLNSSMIEKGKKNFIKLNKKNIKFIKANAENLPFKDNFFDKYVISFCLRNITYIEKALCEALRVLKPGGSFYCLEFSTPQSILINKIYSGYKNKIIPLIGKKIAKNKRAYEYLEQSIDKFPDQEILTNILEKNGFQNCCYNNLFDGIVSIHKGYKIL